MPVALCAGGKQHQHMAPKKGRPLPSLRGAAIIRPPLAGIQPLAARGNSRKKLKSIGVAGVAEGMDVLAVAAATEAAKDSHATADGAAAAKDSQVAALEEAAAGDSLDAVEGPVDNASIDDLSLTIGPISAACMDFTTPGAALAPSRLESSEPQQTVSTIGSHAVTAEQMRTQNRELQLETIRLRRAELEYETAKMQLQMRQSNDSNPGRPCKVCSPCLLCVTVTC